MVLGAKAISTRGGGGGGGRRGQRWWVEVTGVLYKLEVQLGHVSLERRHLCEARGALAAGVRLLACVKPLVLDEVLLCLESTVTEQAQEWA